MKIGYGTIQGFTHRNLEYNNQDFVLVSENIGYNIGLVADGCGSGSNSEVGAQLGLKYLLRRISEQINSDWKLNLKEDLQNYSKQLAKLHSDNPKAFIKDFLLYTLLGFIEKDNKLTIFSFGDGVIIIDDQINVINQNNRPKYVNNELIGNESGAFNYKELSLNKQTIIIGSDGVEDFIDGINSGQIEEYENLEQFIGDENNFSNPIHIPKLLKKYSRKGILKDDCTLIIMLEGTITLPEKLLKNNDRHCLAEEVRKLIDSIIHPQIQSSIEDILNVRVVDFLSDTTIEQNMTGAIAIFEFESKDI